MAVVRSWKRRLACRRDGSSWEGLLLAVALVRRRPKQAAGAKRPAAVPVPANATPSEVPRPNGGRAAWPTRTRPKTCLLPADRHTLQKLADSRKLLAEGRFGEAVRYLGDILEAPEDFFFQPEKNSAVHRSLKAEAQRLIGQMPREGREMYELQYGARARRMLDEALAAGDVAALAEVSRRFFHTRSGYQATFLLGLYHFDHGRPSLGAADVAAIAGSGTVCGRDGARLVADDGGLLDSGRRAGEGAGRPGRAAGTSAGIRVAVGRPRGADLHQRRRGRGLVRRPDGVARARPGRPKANSG